MRTLRILLRTNFLELVGSFRKKGKTSVIAAACTLIVLGLFMIGIFGIMGASTAFILVEKGLAEFSIYISLALGFIVALMFGVTNSTRDAKGNDTDMLLAMPIPKSHIVISKLLGMYLLDVLCTLVLLLPSMLIVVLVGGESPLLLLRGLIFGLLIPAIPLFISLIISAVISALKRLTKFGQMFSVLVSIMVVILYMFVVPNMTSFADSLEATTEEALEMMQRIPPLYWLTEAIYSGDILCVLLSLLITLVPLGLAIFIHARSLNSIKMQADNSKKERVYRSSSARKAAFRMEFSRYFSSANWVMNTVFGVVILLIGVGYVAVKGVDGLSVFSEITVDGKSVADVLNPVAWVAIAACVMNFFGMMTYTTPASVSIEGKRIWISKSLPIATRDILNAKILVSLLIYQPFALISSIILGIRLECNPLHIIILYLISGLFQLLASLIGLIFGLIFVKLDWKNEAQVIKSGFAMTLTIFSCMGLGLITSAFCVFAIILREQQMLATGLLLGEIVVLAGLSIGAYAIITHYGVRKYESLNG